MIQVITLIQVTIMVIIFVCYFLLKMNHGALDYLIDFDLDYSSFSLAVPKSLSFLGTKMCHVSRENSVGAHSTHIMAT